MDKNSKLKLKLKSEKSLDNEDNKKLFKDQLSKIIYF
jgi:hypothetical protein